MKYFFQHKKRNFVSPSDYVMFYLLYKLQWNTKPFYLRASFCKYRESGDSFKIFTFFIFCPNKAFSELFSKIQLKDPISKSRKVWKSPFWRPAAFENWQKWCIFVSLVLVNAITSRNVLLTFHSTSLALSKTLDYFWKAVKIVLFLAVLVTPLEALERLG